MVEEGVEHLLVVEEELRLEGFVKVNWDAVLLLIQSLDLHDVV